METPKKIFCRNCEYFDRFIPASESICRHPLLGKAVENPVEIDTEPPLCFKQNRRNDCRYFKTYEWPKKKKRRKVFFFNIGGSHV